MSGTTPTIPEAFGIGLLGICIVFIVLILLMAVIYIMAAVMREKKTAMSGIQGVSAPAVEAAIPAPQEVSEPAPEPVPEASAPAPVSAQPAFSGARRGPVKYKLNIGGVEYETISEEAGGSYAAPIISEPAPAPKPAPVPVQKPAPAPKPAPVMKSEPAQKPADSAAGQTVFSPLPGTVLSVDVKAGDFVKSGQVLLILEAMKMENEVLAPGDGKVVSVAVNVGAAVNVGDTLVVLG